MVSQEPIKGSWISELDSRMGGLGSSTGQRHCAVSLCILGLNTY